MTISERVKEVRKLNKLTQAAFGERLGTTRDVISNIENNRVEPSKIILKLICSTFCISYDWLESETGEMQILNREDDKRGEILAKLSLINNSKIEEIVDNLLDLDEKYIDTVKELVLALSDKK